MKKVNVIKGLAGLAVMAAAFVITVFPVCAAEGKVIAKTAKIRASASTDSAVVASTSQGKTIDIQGAVNDGAGVKWYQVPIAGGGYGYIRADLVETSETIEVSSNAGSTQTAQSDVKPAATVPTSVGEQQAVIKSSQNVRVRTGASTQHDTVTSLPNGTPVTIIGEANDSGGKKWYQITCSYNGRNIEGYVRWDLVEIGGAPAAGGEDGSQEGEGENPEVPEGENPEGEGEEPFEGGEAPEPEHNDYEVVYDLDQDSGEYEYYLYMNLEGNKVKVNDLLNSVNASRENMQKLQDQVDKEKIIIIILAAVIVLLFIVITVLLFKIRGLYYEDDDEDDEEDDDEEEEEEEEPAPVRRKVRKRVVEEEEETPVPVKRKRPPTSGENPRPARPSQDRSGQPRAKGEKELHAAERKEPARKAASRKPQNFLVDDDEFEFEFLNMDDKDI